MRYFLKTFYGCGQRDYGMQQEIIAEPHKINGLARNLEEQIKYHFRDPLAYVEVYEMKKIELDE